MKHPRSFSTLALVMMCAFSFGAQRPDRSSAEALFDAGKWTGAKSAYEALRPDLKGDQLAEVQFRIGYCWQRLRNHDRAIEAFEKGLAVPGLNDAKVRTSLLLRLGYSLRMVNRGEEGIAALERAIAVEGAPVNSVAESLLYAAWEHNTRKQYAEALQKFRRIRTLKGVHANYIATANLNVGRVLQKQGRYREAIESYQTIATLNPVAAVNRSRARVYILECEALLAGDNPFHIRPYVIKISGPTARLRWVSQGEVEKGKVSLSGGGRTRVIAATTSAIADSICHLHEVVLSDLKPGQDYHYQASCAGQRASGSFRAAPEAPASISFCVIGDTQSYAPRLQPLLDAVGRADPDLVLHVGDITDRGNLWGEWKASFFDPGHPYLSRSLFSPAYGNHDGGPYFKQLFDLKNHWHSFDYGDAHFIMLDSYGAGVGRVGRRQQLEWLENDLKHNTRKWTFVSLHVPMVATRRSLRWFGEDDFLPLLEKHEVDIVFSGHHPLYRRYFPIGSPGKRPVLHLTTGGAGGPVGGYVPSPILQRGINTNHFTSVFIEGDRLRLTAVDIGGQTIDEFEIDKSKPLDETVFGPSVTRGEAKQIISLFQEISSDRTFELHFDLAGAVVDGRQARLAFDVSKLPRGPLDTKAFPPDTELVIRSTEESKWLIPETTIRLADGRSEFTATCGNDLTGVKPRDLPRAEVVVRLKHPEKRYAEFRTKARIHP